MTGDLFRGRTVSWLVGVGAVSLACALLLSVFADDLGAPPISAGPTTFSRSAIGHRAFLQLLRHQQVPVIVSQGNSGAKAGSSAVLIVAEPQAADDTLTELSAMLAATDTSLVVLPKRGGPSRTDRPGWLSRATMVPVADAEAVLQAATDHQLGEGALVRGGPCAPVVTAATAERADDADGADGAASAPAPTTTTTATTPTIRDAQLLSSDRLEPIVTCGDHILVGAIECDDHLVYVLSDPDLIANFGLGLGDNADVALRLIDRVRDGARSVVIDESLHGFRSQPSLWRSLFEFPLVLATLQGLVALLALLLAATVRFGAPRPLAPPIAAGKDFLIANVASLLHFGGHAGHTLTRYLDMTVREVAVRLHAPAELDGDALRAWLARVGESRAVTVRLADLEAEVAATAALAARSRRHAHKIALAAERAHRWKQEMLRGAA